MAWKTLTYSGWGRMKQATGPVARPERVSSLARALEDRPGPAIGNCRSYGDACLANDAPAIQTTRLDRILGFDEETGILEAEAGLRVGEIARIFAPKGWLPAVMPGTGFATVGGCIANDVHGKNHHSVGSFGQHVVELTLMQGGVPKTVTPKKKNTKLFEATIGGLGQTGVIASAKLQLLACKGDVMMVTERRIDGFDEFIAALDASNSPYSVGWIDATARGDDLGRGILEEGETGYGLVPAKKSSKSVPFDAPGFTLSAPIVKAFNTAYFRRVPAAGRTLVKPIQDFFFPLDRIHDWNRLYGKAGFIQFQCVVPPDKAEALKTILKEIAKAGLASPLAVLKRMGPGRAGLMSFPMEGYTLAVDFKNTGLAKSLIGRLEQMTADAEGRVYLAKDATLNAKHMPQMYPELPKFVAYVNKLDPDGAFETDLTRRLQIRSAS
ncbi:MAG: FAD-binding oxidoreductase [Litoreibacter sp.]|nr:FAD-binding oxidoreductase [Litoreibacter sp.]